MSCTKWQRNKRDRSRIEMRQIVLFKVTQVTLLLHLVRALQVKPNNQTDFVTNSYLGYTQVGHVGLWGIKSFTVDYKQGIDNMESFTESDKKNI